MDGSFFLCEFHIRGTSKFTCGNQSYSPKETSNWIVYVNVTQETRSNGLQILIYFYPLLSKNREKESEHKGELEVE